MADHLLDLHDGMSYAHFTATPSAVTINQNATTFDSRGTPVVLGVDEAGRGPVIGPMVYGIFYLPLELHHSLLSNTHHFNDSKQLTPLVRARLMRTLCTPSSDLYSSCGWAIKSLSARDISSGMFHAGGSYNLNSQAMDATIEVIRGVIEQGVNVVEVYVDTIGQPAAYQKRLERVFPAINITVEKRADSLFPCVSAASVVAKVTRDVSCEVLHAGVSEEDPVEAVNGSGEAIGWGSGYPSDARCVTWMRGSMNETFGWGPECRFSWGTAKDMLEDKGRGAMQVDWPDNVKDNDRVSQYFAEGMMGGVKSEEAELRNWYGSSVSNEVF